MAAITFNAAHQREHVREQLTTVLAALPQMLDTFVSNRMRHAAAEAEHVRPRQIPARIIFHRKPQLIAMQLTCPDLLRRKMPARSAPRSIGRADVPASCRPIRPQPSPRNFGLSIPASSTRRSRHFSSAATWKASGLPATPRDGSAEFSCSRTRQFRLRERIARRQAVRQYSHPRGSNSTWITRATRSSRSLVG